MAGIVFSGGACGQRVPALKRYLDPGKSRLISPRFFLSSFGPTFKFQFLPHRATTAVHARRTAFVPDIKVLSSFPAPKTTNKLSIQPAQYGVVPRWSRSLRRDGYYRQGSRDCQESRACLPRGLHQHPPCGPGYSCTSIALLLSPFFLSPSNSRPSFLPCPP